MFSQNKPGRCFAIAVASLLVLALAVVITWPIRSAQASFQPTREHILRTGHYYMVGEQCYQVSSEGQLMPCSTPDFPRVYALLESGVYVTENKDHWAAINVAIFDGKLEELWPVTKTMRTVRPFRRQLVAFLVGFALDQDYCVRANAPL